MTAARAKGRKKKAMTSREKVRAYRKRMRAMGLRPVTFWLPNVNSKEFKEQAHRASLAIARSATEADDQAFVDAASADEWPTE
jgi:Antitoxin MazE-like